MRWLTGCSRSRKPFKPRVCWVFHQAHGEKPHKCTVSPWGGQAGCPLRRLALRVLPPCSKTQNRSGLGGGGRRGLSCVTNSWAGRGRRKKELEKKSMTAELTRGDTGRMNHPVSLVASRPTCFGEELIFSIY